MRLKNFDKIYCLHCIEDVERFNSSQYEFNKVGLLDKVEYRMTSFQPNLQLNRTPLLKHLKGDPEYHCTREHYTMIKVSYLLNYKYIFIFEDDIKMLKKDYFDLIVNNIPNNFDIIRLMGFGYPNIKGPNLFKAKQYWQTLTASLWSTGAYGLSRKGMKYYLDYVESKYCVADMPLYDVNSINKNRLNAYISTIPGCYYYDYESNIQKRNLNDNSVLCKLYYKNVDTTLYDQ